MSFDKVCSAALYPSNVEDVSTRAKAVCYTCAVLETVLFLAASTMLTRNLRLPIIKWPLFNALCSLFCFGSSMGIVAWLCYPLFIDYQLRFFADQSVVLNGTAFKSQAGAGHASSGVYYASIFICTSGLAFCCYSCGKLLVLERVIKFGFPGLLQRKTASSPHVDHQMNPKRMLFLRLAAGAAFFCLIVGWLCVAIGSFGYLTAVQHLHIYTPPHTNDVMLRQVLEASRARAQQRDAWMYAASDPATFKSLYEAGGLQYNAAFQKALINEALQSWASFVVLFLISLAFTICTVAASARFISVRRQTGSLDRSAESLLNNLRSQILVTTLSVFLTFLLRSVYAGTFAVAKEAPLNGSCPQLCDSSPGCQSSSFVLGQYMLYDPLPLALVTMISEPITSLIVLWGMSQHRSRASSESGIQLRTAPST